MGELTIYFVGICTHVENQIEGVPHRVVLVHEEKSVVINRHTIHSHMPGIQLRPRDVLAGSLPSSVLRQVLHVANARGDAPSYDSLYRSAIPSLGELAGGRLKLDERVVTAKEHPATMYFDVKHGRFSACRVPHEASGAVLRIETEGDPQLILTPMDGDREAVKIDLRSGAVVTIHNGAFGAQDHVDADFLLHYKIMERIPSRARFPRKPMGEGLPILPDLEVELGPGCSNSNYP